LIRKHSYDVRVEPGRR